MIYDYLGKPSLTDEFRSAIEMVAQHMRLPPPSVRSAPVDGVSYVFADRVFLVDESWLSKGLSKLLPSERWPALVGTAAHEIIHTTEKPGFVLIEAEMRADHFAGRVLRDMKISTEPLKKLIRAVHRNSPAHPSLEERMLLIG